MSTVNIDSKLLEALQMSTCFGLAHDESVPECKQCDVKGSCKAKMEGALIGTPTSKPTPVKPKEESKPKADTKKATAPVKKPEPAKKPTTPASKPAPAKKPTSAPSGGGNAPDFKPMTLEELETLARERNVEWKDYGNDNITRMRLIMALKKSY